MVREGSDTNLRVARRLWKEVWVLTRAIMQATHWRGTGDVDLPAASSSRKAASRRGQPRPPRMRTATQPEVGFASS